MQNITHKLEFFSNRLNHNLHRLRHNQLAILKYDHAISNAQTFPITKSTNCAIEFKRIREFLNYSKHTKSQYQAVFIQSIWNSPPAEVTPVLEQIHTFQSKAKVIFLDWYAPLHIPQPEILEMVDLYVKKQVLRDYQHYSGMYDTNLVEYESQWNENFKNTRYLQLETKLLDEKLFVGWNFATDRMRISQLNKYFYLNKDRPIDIHCRLCAPSNRTNWYEHMRGRAYDAVQALRKEHHPKVKILNDNVRIGYRKYINEIVHSKLCISPFGYGEVCWRDFEAILSGALLIKPDMGHLITNPNIYIPYETYIPCRWDFSDLDFQCMRYLQDESERQRIVLNAVQVWKNFLKHGWQELWSNMMDRLSISQIQVQPLMAEP